MRQVAIIGNKGASNKAVSLYIGRCLSLGDMVGFLQGMVIVVLPLGGWRELLCCLIAIGALCPHYAVVVRGRDPTLDSLVFVVVPQLRFLSIYGFVRGDATRKGAGVLCQFRRWVS